MQLDKFKEALELFRDKVIEESKKNLRKIGKGGGTLENSIEGTEVKVTDRSLEFEIKMADYGVFQDKGVSGIKQKYNTPYSYKTKMPPPSKLDKWIVKKGIAPRTSGGKFKGRTISKVGFAKSIQFLIARSIFYKGIKPSLFFTKPFQKYAKGLPKELETAFALDTEALLAFVTKQQLNNK
tara:strand:+ start:55 stop:597 length:543 start_codon:yes stop_codon:yes gene_type:complete